jgi:N-acetylmuramic acid 6-phosphate (MurNAc-6-P) etherase
VLTGSTRLKAGTATKLVLNLITTLALARSGKVMSNLMIDLKPSNSKLRGRAIRIVRELTGADEAAARTALETNGWVIREACAKLPTLPAK